MKAWHWCQSISNDNFWGLKCTRWHTMRRFRYYVLTLNQLECATADACTLELHTKSKKFKEWGLSFFKDSAVYISVKVSVWIEQSLLAWCLSSSLQAALQQYRCLYQAQTSIRRLFWICQPVYKALGSARVHKSLPRAIKPYDELFGSSYDFHGDSFRIIRG